MKHLQIVSLFIIIASFLSCKKDDPADTIVGNWKTTKLVSSGCTDPEENQNLTFTDGCYKESLLQVSICISATFSENGTYTLVTKTTFFGATETDNIDGTYSISGNKITLCETPSLCEVSDFTLTENTLILNSKDVDSSCMSVLTMVK